MAELTHSHCDGKGLQLVDGSVQGVLKNIWTFTLSNFYIPSILHQKQQTPSVKT
jgi:hypothetical protein